MYRIIYVLKDGDIYHNVSDQDLEYAYLLKDRFSMLGEAYSTLQRLESGGWVSKAKIVKENDLLSWSKIVIRDGKLVPVLVTNPF